MAFGLGNLHAPTRQYRNAFVIPMREAADEKRNSASATSFVKFDETSEGKHWTCTQIRL